MLHLEVQLEIWLQNMSLCNDDAPDKAESALCTCDEGYSLWTPLLEVVSLSSHDPRSTSSVAQQVMHPRK